MPLVRALLVGVAVVALAGCDIGSSPPRRADRGPSPGSVLLSEPFDGGDKLLTNEYAFWNPAVADAVPSKIWELTSGSLFVRSGTGWTGPPDDRRPDPTSSTGTNSAVFRLTTKRSDFGDVAVDFDLRLDHLGETETTPPVDWDGVHVFLRYQNEVSLYYASVDRRDGAAVIKKKVRGGPSNGGTYYDLATGHHAVPSGAWEHVRATVADNADGSVTIMLFAAGTLVASATDSGTGGPPIVGTGRVGIRGDNAEFDLDEFRVTAL